MHCASCAMNIDGELEDTDGIKNANTNYARAVTEVEFDPEKITPQQIVQVIKNTGYQASLLD
ncbi:heavy-metal-associated domain-containing protein [Candidatus Microgenomates bacterium]|nr:heavy-metal-associated domain-containing protein [Candidatus Microgenomates bacterium]